MDRAKQGSERTRSGEARVGISWNMSVQARIETCAGSSIGLHAEKEEGGREERGRQEERR